MVGDLASLRGAAPGTVELRLRLRVRLPWSGPSPVSGLEDPGVRRWPGLASPVRAVPSCGLARALPVPPICRRWVTRGVVVGH